MSGQPPAIFLSHSHADNAVCDALAAALRERGFAVWYDNTHLPPGSILTDHIQQALLTHRAFVVILSPTAVASYWVKLETGAYHDLVARDPGRVIVPVVVAPCEVPPLLRGITWINAANKLLDEVIDQIAAALEPSHMPASPQREAFDAAILPATFAAQFRPQFERYLENIQRVRAAEGHHDQRRQVFVEFLRDAFGVPPEDVEIEQFIQLKGQQVAVPGTARLRKGWIDAVFKDLIFEFKRDLKREEADGLRELRDYLTALPQGEQCVGLLTDGVQFIGYVLDATLPNGLRQTAAINLDGSSAAEAFLWFDAYLFRQKQQPPTSADIVRRFGLTSPTFVTAKRILREALERFGQAAGGALDVKRQQWAFHLARVYGSADATNNEMFLHHTYLCQFAKILAFAAQSSADEAANQIAAIIDGKAFEVVGINNIGEQDFFAWVLAPEVREQVVPALAQIARSLAVYDLTRINEDLLKQLYQNLVEAETRHELGEFYTPDWLADLTLEQIAYKPGQSLLDPACGSGTFLFTAIRRLVRQGVTGQALVDFALDNIMGVDVHPLAVTIAKINYMLAILPHLKAGRRRDARAIPIAMANSLQLPDKVSNINVIAVPCDNDKFQIPTEAARRPNELVAVLQQMGHVAQQFALDEHFSVAAFGKYALSQLPPVDTGIFGAFEEQLWNENARRLGKQIRSGRDSIWIFVLQNTARPLFLQYRKFDVIAGNPPWLSYRYIQDKDYQADIKRLVKQYDLLESSDAKLNTQIELSTIFFAHAVEVYLKPAGTLAFVMPRSVITGAKQHLAFQKLGFSHVLDLKGVAPLFNVETCVLLRQGNDTHTAAIPATRYAGRLPAHECSLEVARQFLTATPTVTDFAQIDGIASPYYYPRFKQGATLVPRNLVFVTSAERDLAPGQLALGRIMTTDPDVNDEAKVPWKGLSQRGYIDDDFLYATLLSKNLVPFGTRKLHLVALPVVVKDRHFKPMTPAAMRDTFTLSRSANEWFEPVERMWEKDRKSASMSLWERFNYQQGVISQNAGQGYTVIYNAAGSNISACMLDLEHLPITNGAQPQGFVTEHKMYWHRAATKEEAYFLVALLNAPSVDSAIKPYQTRGIYVGPRDIERRPFEVCPIPQYDAANPEHQQLAALSQAAHAAVGALDLRAGGVVAARKQARLAATAQIAAIDTIARRLLGLAALPVVVSADDGDEDVGGDEDGEV